jgi:galactokinase
VRVLVGARPGACDDVVGAQPALRSQLAADRAALDDAKAELVAATDAQIAAPDDARRKQDLEAASRRIDELADQIIRSVLPTDQLKRGAKPNVGAVSNDDLERGGKALIAAENNLADFKEMTPAELVAAANDASAKAATFAAQLAGRGAQVRAVGVGSFVVPSCKRARGGGGGGGGGRCHKPS